jgi:hypothetical protein
VVECLTPRHRDRNPFVYSPRAATAESFHWVAEAVAGMKDYNLLKYFIPSGEGWRNGRFAVGGVRGDLRFERLSQRALLVRSHRFGFGSVRPLFRFLLLY